MNEIDVNKFLKAQEPIELRALDNCIKNWKEPICCASCKKEAMRKLKMWKEQKMEILNANNL